MCLPGHSRGTWSRSAMYIRRSHPRESEFADLIHFVDNEATLVNNPLFLKEAFSGYVDKRVVLVIKRQQFRHTSQLKIKMQPYHYILVDCVKGIMTWMNVKSS